MGMATTNQPGTSGYTKDLQKYLDSIKTSDSFQYQQGDNPYAQIGQEAEDRLAQMRAAELASLAGAYQSAAQDAYIRRMQAEANLPAVAQKAGGSGGFTDSMAIAAQAAYGNALSKALSDQLAAEAKVNLDYDEKTLKTALDLADKAIAQRNKDYERQYKQFIDNYAQLMDLAGMYQKMDSTARDDLLAESKFNYQKGQDSIQNQLAREKFEDSSRLAWEKFDFDKLVKDMQNQLAWQKIGGGSPSIYKYK